MIVIAILTTSWDDGTPEDLELGELLSRYGYRGTFYATTGPGGRRTIDDHGLAELVQLGHEIGNHGRSHRRFVELAPDELIDEVSWGEAEVKRFAATRGVIAPPQGAVNRSVIRRLNSCGLTVRTAPILGSRRARTGTMVPTVQVYPHTPLRTYGHLVRHRILPALALLKAWSRSRTLRQRLAETVRSASSRPGVVHLWGHSQEIDRLGLWSDLEYLLQHALELRLEPATNGEVADSYAATR